MDDRAPQEVANDPLPNGRATRRVESEGSGVGLVARNPGRWNGFATSRKFYVFLPVAKLPNEPTFSSMADPRRSPPVPGSPAKPYPLATRPRQHRKMKWLGARTIGALSLFWQLDRSHRAKLPPRHCTSWIMVYLRDPWRRWKKSMTKPAKRSRSWMRW